MITIGYSTKSHNKKFYNHLKKVSSNAEIIEVVNKGDISLTSVYNNILEKAKYDHVVLVHDDVKIEKGFDKKIHRMFNKTSYGIIGVAGTSIMPKSGIWWENRDNMYGEVFHINEFKKWVKLVYPAKFYRKIMPVVVVDGLFIAVNKNRIKSKFNESYDGFHFYDITFCINNFTSGVKIGVTNQFDIYHKSIGVVSNQWRENKDIFKEEYKDILPIDLNYAKKQEKA